MSNIINAEILKHQPVIVSKLMTFVWRCPPSFNKLMTVRYLCEHYFVLKTIKINYKYLFKVGVQLSSTYSPDIVL